METQTKTDGKTSQRLNIPHAGATTPQYPCGRNCQFCGTKMAICDGFWVCPFFFCEMKGQEIEEIEEDN